MPTNYGPMRLGSTLAPVADSVFASTPEQQAQNESGWREFLTRFKSDPNLQAGVLQMGLTMMQPRANTQSIGGHVANSLTSGLNQMAALEAQRQAQAERDQKMQMEQQKLAQGQQQVDAYGRSVDATNQASLRADERARMQLEEARRARLGTERYHQGALDLQSRQLQATIDNNAEMRRQGAEGGATGILTNNLADALMKSNPTLYPTRDAAYVGAVRELHQAKASAGEDPQKFVLRLMPSLVLPGAKTSEILDATNQALQAYQALTSGSAGAGAPGAAGAGTNPLVGREIETSNGVRGKVSEVTPQGDVVIRGSDGGVWVVPKATWDAQIGGTPANAQPK